MYGSKYDMGIARCHTLLPWELAVAQWGNACRVLTPSGPGNRETALGKMFEHLVGWYQRGECLLSSPGRWTCILLEGLIIRAWYPLSPECGGSSIALLGTDILERATGLWHGF